MSQNVTISNEFTLPSKGLIYNPPIQPVVKLRSMTTEDEMRRLGHSERPYKIMCDLIDGCIIENKPSISVYDMCLADYYYLLHALRIVTYGVKYPISSICPYCAYENTQEMDLSQMTVKGYDAEEVQKYREITLPSTGKLIGLRFQTPRILDNIGIRKKSNKVKGISGTADTSILHTLLEVIDTVDGEVYDNFKLEHEVRDLPMMDTNYILQSSLKLDNCFGIDPKLTMTCSDCGLEYRTSFRYTTEFFGPTIH